MRWKEIAYIKDIAMLLTRMLWICLFVQRGNPLAFLESEWRGVNPIVPPLHTLSLPLTRAYGTKHGALFIAALQWDCRLRLIFKNIPSSFGCIAPLPSSCKKLRRKTASFLTTPPNSISRRRKRFERFNVAPPARVLPVQNSRKPCFVGVRLYVKGVFAQRKDTLMRDSEVPSVNSSRLR